MGRWEGTEDDTDNENSNNNNNNNNNNNKATTTHLNHELQSAELVSPSRVGARVQPSPFLLEPENTQRQKS